MDVALVTGGSRGIGAALVARCRGRFDAVIVIGRTPFPDEGADPRIGFLAADLGAAIDWDAALAGLAPLRDARRIVLFDNAAELHLGTTGGAGFAAAAGRSLAVNVAGPIGLVEALMRRCADQGSALLLVHLTSGGARRPIARWGAYGLSKAAARLYFETVAVEHPNIRVVLCDPGVVATAMQDQIRDDGAPAPASLRTPDEAAARILAEAGF